MITQIEMNVNQRLTEPFYNLIQPFAIRYHIQHKAWTRSSLFIAKLIFLISKWFRIIQTNDNSLSLRLGVAMLEFVAQCTQRNKQKFFMQTLHSSTTDCKIN